MPRVVWVALGGAIGSVARYLVQGWVQTAAESRGRLVAFPWGTLVVNLSGCLAIGLLAGLFQERLLVAPETRSFVLIGILGGYTTFSSFGWETLALARDAGFALALGNVVASVALGLAGVWLGAAIARGL
jgi:CrcB protein